MIHRTFGCGQTLRLSAPIRGEEALRPYGRAAACRRSPPTTASNDISHPLDRRALRIVEQVGVACGGDGVAVPEQAADQRKGGAAAGQLGGEAMAQVVDAQALDPGGPAELQPGFLHRDAMPGLAIGREHPRPIGLAPELGQQLLGRRGQRDDMVGVSAWSSSPAWSRCRRSDRSRPSAPPWPRRTRRRSAGRAGRCPRPAGRRAGRARPSAA